MHFPSKINPAVSLQPHFYVFHIRRSQSIEINKFNTSESTIATIQCNNSVVIRLSSTMRASLLRALVLSLSILFASSYEIPINTNTNITRHENNLNLQVLNAKVINGTVGEVMRLKVNKNTEYIIQYEPDKVNLFIFNFSRLKQNKTKK